jgi:outer membrane protein OmpA-like peptidoglycan-associated protein
MDRKARRAVTALVLVVIAAMALAVRSCVETITPAPLVADTGSGDDQILLVGGETMVLQRGTVGSKIAEWLNRGGSGTRGFVVDDQAFAAGSDALTPEASVRLDRLVKVMKANDRLNARLLITTYEGSDAAQRRQLAVKRSERIRAEMIARGVPETRIASAALPLSRRGARRNEQRPTILIVLSEQMGSR